MHWHNILGIPYRVGIREHIELELKKNFCTNLVPLLYQTLMDLWRLMHGNGIRRGCGSIRIEAFVGIWREVFADILTARHENNIPAPQHSLLRME